MITGIKTPFISLSVESQPVGSLCIVGGEYTFRGRRSLPLTIPPEICDQSPALVHSISKCLTDD